MIFTRLKIFFFAFVASFLLAACGGGGSDSAPPSIAVSFTPSSVDAYGNASNALAYFSVTARLSQVPTTNVYVYVVDPAGYIQTGGTIVNKNSDGSFSANMSSRPGLAMGVYTGTLTLRLCKDSACASEYTLSGATLPYKITILPVTDVTITQNSMPATTDTYGVYQFNVGDIISMTANVPVTWNYPNVTNFDSVVLTSTTFTATAASSGGPFTLMVQPPQTPAAGLVGKQIKIN